MEKFPLIVYSVFIALVAISIVGIVVNLYNAL